MQMVKATPSNSQGATANPMQTPGNKSFTMADLGQGSCRPSRWSVELFEPHICNNISLTSSVSQATMEALFSFFVASGSFTYVL